MFKTFKTELPKISDEANKVLSEVQEGIQYALNEGIEVDFSDGFVGEMEITDESLKSFLQTWDGTGDVAERYQQHLAKSTSHTVKFAKTLKNIGANLAISAAISFAISTITGLIKAGSEIADKAEEIGKSFSSTKSTIADYKEQVESLHATINDSTSSFEEVADARKQLFTIQNELIDNYGTERESIYAITDAINGEVDAWDRLTEREWTAAKDEYNKNYVTILIQTLTLSVRLIIQGINS